jgi:carbonic anhydrase
MKPSDRLLLDNKSWAQERTALDPTYFERLAKEQRPEFLWIGCSDSRVPANVVTGTDAGEIFVHRNIANVCVPTDLNLLSVVQFAVEVLQVKHVIVCGHLGCGGVRAAMARRDMGPLSHWLRNIRDVYDRYYDEITALPPEQRADRLCELNVIEQARSLAKASLVQEAWQKRNGPWVHAWVYGLHDGILRELEAIAPRSELPPAYRLEF